MPFEPLPDGDETEFVEAAEGGQVRGREGSVEHVEVFLMGSVGTSIMEDLDTHTDADALPRTTPPIAKSPFSITTRE
jgi:hypothetical protein